MGNGMNKILPGLYVGNFHDSKDVEQLNANKITHILAIHDTAKALLKDREYLCILASDNSEQNLTQFFPQCIDFIHSARLNGGCVLVHCLAGISRSVTVTSAYIMTVTKLGWKDALNAVRGARNVARPNFGFQHQLQMFEVDGLQEERKRVQEKFPVNPLNDEQSCKELLEGYRKFVLHGATVDNELYNLPPNAYKDRPRSNRDKNPDDETDTSGASS
ncbi:dual specificity protein phosphatase 22-B-like [Haliotis asinina]|uniref:dual specificity protein phosphatase 22-B-like n=1 Tax=Haliotis asinina TaxID=109174 RepID=UPI003532006F